MFVLLPKMVPSPHPSQLLQGCCHFERANSDPSPKRSRKRPLIRTHFWIVFCTYFIRFSVPKSLQNRSKVQICFKISF